MGRRSVSASDRYVETNGIRLHYLDHGGGEPTLVLAPGLTANAHSFDGLMRAGLGDVARVLALDLRGRGESDAPPSGYAMEDHARDVIGLLDALELERVVMGGHSFGGLLTYWLAANHPERVERCVVLDAPAGVNPPDHGADPAVARAPRPCLRVLGRVPRARSGDAVLRRRRLGRRRRELLPRRRALPARRDGAGALPSRAHPRGGRAIAAVDWAGVVRRVTQPTLLLRAPGSFGPPGFPPLLSREDAEATVALMADGRLVDGVGNHITFVFGPGAPVLTGAIAAFLAGRAVVSGRSTGDSGTAGVVRWRWR